MDQVKKSDEQWRKELTPQQYEVLRRKGTEPPGTGKYLYHQESGMYRCAACGAELFSSDTKFEADGWPSFTEPANLEHIELRQDSSLGMIRTEVSCKRCGSHLGHVFDDGPASTGGQRYCINSAALKFAKQKK